MKKLLVMLALANWGAGGVHADDPVRTANFLVFARDPAIARQVSRDAEDARRSIALRWAGRDLAPWPFPCVILVGIAGPEGNGATEDFLGIVHVIRLIGPDPSESTRFVSHEVGHAVADTINTPCPLFLSEGIAVDAEPGYPFRLHDQMGFYTARELVEVRTYPTFLWEGFYGASYSLSRFLLDHFGREATLGFVRDHKEFGWEDSAVKNLGVDLDDLDDAWRASLRSWESPYPRTWRGR